MTKRNFPRFPADRKDPARCEFSSQFKRGLRNFLTLEALAKIAISVCESGNPGCLKNWIPGERLLAPAFKIAGSFLNNGLRISRKLVMKNTLHKSEGRHLGRNFSQGKSQ
jgi:hypothetical protein